MVTKCAKKNGGQPAKKTETVKMRTLSLVLACAFVLAGPTLAGSPDSSLPGIGTFAYNSSPIVTAALPLVVAAR